jgi:phosphoribosyl 1,2-cyclic phosphodiesterase
MRILSLGSSSHGNATIVELAGTRVLVDAGFSARSLSERLARVGVAPQSVSAVLLSHEHHDHARGAERFSVRHRIPIFSAAETLEALDLSPVHLAGWQPFAPGVPFDVGGIRVDPFAVPHDARCPVGFVLAGEGLRIGIATDLGHATTLVVERLRGCDFIMVEANHDDGMLQNGPYPWHLKQRVSGRMGHLSNDEAAALLERVGGEWTRGVILAHLSEKNNTPALARSAAASALQRAGCRRVEMRVVPSRHPSVPIEL